MMNKKNTTSKVKSEAQGTTAAVASRAASYAPTVVRRTISQTRKDIQEWNRAKQMAGALQEPRQYFLQDIYNIIADDAHLSSQVNNRKEQTISAPFEMVTPDKKRDDTLSDLLTNIPIIQDLFGYILDAEYYGYSLVELSAKDGLQQIDLVSRANVVPDFGKFYPDAYKNNFIPYREISEFGRFLLEFNADHYGNFNKAVPHVLFKKFAQSCWSELCEIYGIPPRFMKTNTQDPVMLNNAENMMKEVGAAAWFIIDSTEEFEFAQGIVTSGDVYNNLIRLCNNEMSMLISGAVVGQDTKNGNESKEKISMLIADRLVNSDKRMVEMYMNSRVIPAFIRIGWLPSTVSTFRFSSVEDTDKLWTMTTQLLEFKEVDNQWITDKFGIPVSDKAQSPSNF